MARRTSRTRTPEEERAIIEERLRTVKSWGLSLDDYETMVAENRHVYSPVSGFYAEYKCRHLHLAPNRHITKIARPTGYDKRDKGDFVITYRDEPIRLEVKSLDGPSVIDLGNDRWEGTFQCNASDARNVTLPNGHSVHTNCIVAGGWEVLAVNLYDFGRRWRFAFAHQRDLPRASSHYEAEDRPYLLASAMPITLPLTAPYTSKLTSILDAIVAARRAGR